MNENKPRIVALLPMKAHSERVSGKNFRNFCGKPLFQWVLDTLLCIDEIEEVVINTDARDILASYNLVNSERVRIRDRNPELCGDLVSMNLVLADDVANVDADIYIMTHATNPLLKAETVRDALGKFWRAKTQDKVDSLFTVNKIQARFYRSDCSPVNHDPSNLIRTQDIEPWFEENSGLYIFTRESFASTNARIGARPMMYEITKCESIDIDTLDDWEFAVVAAEHLLKTS